MEIVISRFIMFLFLFVLSNILFARDFKVDQIPNGSKFTCGNCHLNPSAGGGSTPFGDVCEIVSVSLSFLSYGVFQLNLS